MNSRFSGMGVVLALVAILSTASLAGFSGSLGALPTGDPAGGLIGGGNWANGGSLSWTVSFNDNLQRWHYSYTLTVPGTPAISHFIVEVSDDNGQAFTKDNLFDPTSDPEGWIDDISIQFYTSATGNSNPGMPSEGIYGIKFDATDDEELETRSLTIAFDSDRVPVWGDFYAKGGDASYIFNSGLGWDDPLDAPHDLAHWTTVPLSTGNYTDVAHVLVPDTITLVPVPGAMLLGSLGLGFAGWLRKRQNV